MKRNSWKFIKQQGGNAMTINEYTESCLKFAEASKGWEKLDENSFYTTFDKSWEMSGDNQNGGVGIEWAFHLTEDEIRKANTGDHVYLVGHMSLIDTMEDVDIPIYI